MTSENEQMKKSLEVVDAEIGWMQFSSKYHKEAVAVMAAVEVLRRAMAGTPNEIKSNAFRIPAVFDLDDSDDEDWRPAQIDSQAYIERRYHPEKYARSQDWQTLRPVHVIRDGMQGYAIERIADGYFYDWIDKKFVIVGQAGRLIWNSWARTVDRIYDMEGR